MPSEPTNPALQAFERDLAEGSTRTDRKLRARVAAARAATYQDALCLWAWSLADQGLTNDRPCDQTTTP